MYKILLKNVTNTHEYEELIKVFLRPAQFTLSLETENSQGERENFDFVFEGKGDKNILKKELYQTLQKLTGKTPPWGIITGIRPVKLAGEIVKGLKGDYSAAREKLLKDYCVHPEKADLTLDLCRYQQSVCGTPKNNAVGIYIGIPFCPTRCLYCSFTSNQVDGQEIQRYLHALAKEIAFVAEQMKEKDLFAESIYIGGGTPTTLNEKQLSELLTHVQKAFAAEGLKEFTLEAGRPDTITGAKLKTALKTGVDRISINPQTMKDPTLKLIGRDHSSEDIEKAFLLSKEAGVPIVNADIIAGLPGESLEDFKETLEEVMGLEPENITVHTLAVKRASKLAGVDKEYHYDHEKTVGQMLTYAKNTLSTAGYTPYYLYRQKQMAGALENIGYCKRGTEGLYNIRIMEENQTIIALGAGGISKVYFPKENRHERVPNVSNYELYIERIEEMIERKKINLFDMLSV